MKLPDLDAADFIPFHLNLAVPANPMS